MLWQPLSERVCGASEAQRSPTPKLHRIHMSFVLHERWHCTFLAEDLCTLIAPARTFSNPDSMLERNRRGNGPRDLACRQALMLVTARPGSSMWSDFVGGASGTTSAMLGVRVSDTNVHHYGTH
jgi:hypothetical protein